MQTDHRHGSDRTPETTGRVRSMRARAFGWGAILLAGFSLLACGGHPDENSGGDAYRHEAQAMPMDEWATGEIDRDGGDATDWKVVSIDEGGKLMVELKADSPGARIQVGVYDKHGISIGIGSTQAGEEGVKVPVNLKGKGKLFIKIEHRGGDKTAYSVRAKMTASGGGGGGPDL